MANLILLSLEKKVHRCQELQTVDRFKEEIFSHSKSIHENPVGTTNEV